MHGAAFRLSARRRWVSLGLLVTAGVAGAVAIAAPGSAGALAATAAVSGPGQTVGDAVGTVMSVTVRNTSRTEPIDAVDVRRPGAGWTIIGCPAGPAGWSRTLTGGACHYRSAPGTGGDLRPGASTSSFRVRVTTATGSADRVGTWSVVAFRNASRATAATVAAAPFGAGLRATAYTLQVTRVVVARTAPRAGTACPAVATQAKAATSVVLVVCGRNASTAAARLAAARASLTGNFASGGVFSSTTTIVARSRVVVLGSFTGSRVAPVAAAGRTVGVRVGAAVNHTSAPVVFGGYRSVDEAPAVTDLRVNTVRGVAVQVRVQGIDPDGDNLRFAIVSSPSHGTVGAFSSATCSGSGPRSCTSLVTYTPATAFTGSDSFRYAATDGVRTSAPATVAVVVDNANSAPVANADNLATSSDSPLTADVRINDTDADGTALSVAGLDVAGTKGHVTIGPDGRVVYDPRGAFPTLAPGSSATDTFRYTVTDGSLVSAPATVTVTVSSPAPPANQPPAAAADSGTTAEDTPLTVAAPGLLANDTDPEGSPLLAVGASAPAHGTVTVNTDGSYTYVPAANYNGPDSFTYRASDGAASSLPGTVNLIVTPVNDAPAATSLLAMTAEDTAGPLTLTGTDADADPVTFSVVTPPTHGTLGTLAAPSCTPSSCTAGVTYTPSANYNGPDSLTYKVNDGISDSGVATITLAVTAVNDAPTATADSFTTAEDTLLSVPASGVLGNDADIDSSSISADIVSAPSHASSFALNSDGSFDYTPARNYNGTDEFSYQADDGTATSAVTTVSLSISAVNDTPHADPVSDSTNEDTARSVTLVGSDDDGDGLTFSIVTNPASGTLAAVAAPSCTTNGDCTATVLYTPNADFNGSDSFTYKTNDGTVDSTAGTVSLTVNAINDAPVAAADSYTTDEDTPLTVAVPGVLGNDTDVDATPLTATNASTPAHGTVALATDGSFVYTPSANYNGSDSFTYTANDGTVDSAPATVSITVNPVNDAAVAAAVSDTTNEDTAKSVTLAGSDVDGDAQTFALVAGPSHGSLGAIGSPSCASGVCSASVTYTPNANYNGSDAFTYQTNDGTVGSNTATVSLTVNAVNDAPLFTKGSDDQVVTSSGARSVSGWATGIAAGPADESGQTVTFQLVPTDPSLFATQPAIDPATGNLTYTPGAGVGTTSVDVTLSDNGGTANGGADTSGAQTFTITLVPPNAVPTVDAASGSGNEDGGAITVTLTGHDADDDNLTFTTGTATNGVLGTPTAPDCTAANICTSTVTYTPTANFFGSDSFTYKANDGTADSATAAADITVDPVNDAPTDIALSNATLPENTSSGSDVGTLTTTDVDSGDTHAFTFVTGPGSIDNAAFSITGSTLKTNTALDFETKTSFAVRIRSTDSGTGALFTEKQFTITVTNVNEAPTDITLTPATVDENQASNTTVGQLTTTDPDAADTFTYLLVTGTGDDDNGSFNVSGGDLRTSASFDFETKSSYSVRIRSTDAGSLVTEKQLTITVTNVNEAPTDIALSATGIDENMPVGAPVGSASTTDPDAANTFTYSLVSGTGSADNGSFTFAGGTLATTARFNFEAKSSYAIRIRATDQGSLFTEKEFTITVNDVNDAPVAADDAFNDANGNTDAIGNTTFSVGVAGVTGPVKNAAGTVLAGDTDEDTLPTPDTLSVTFPTTSLHGTIVTGNANGTFVYLPNAGFAGNDTFDYTLSDGQGGTDVGTVTIQVQNMVWYANAGAGAGPGTGRSSDPYVSLASLQGTDLDGTGDTIFVYSGSYGGGLPLETSQKLWGQPNGLLVDGIQLVAAGSTNPVISNSAGNAITLANSVDVQRVNVGSASGAGFRGTSITSATVGPNTSITNAAGGGIVLSGNATGAIAIDSTVANSLAGDAVVISGRTGGSVTLTGAMTTSNGGVSLSSNTGAALTLSGALHLTGTGATKGFSATSGGTVLVQNTDNIVSTQTGRAVEVISTTIGSGGMKFKTVSAGTAASGPDSGIVLNTTGSQPFSVAGTGAANSGGTIQRTSSHAISLTTTDAPSFAWMSIQNAGHAGVQGVDVTGFTMINSVINNAGAAQNDPTDYSLSFNTTTGGTNNNLDGALTLTNNTLSNAYGGGLAVFNYNGTISNATITGNAISSTTSTVTSKGSGIALDLFGSGSTVANLTKATISGNTVSNFPSGDGIRIQGGNAAGSAAPSGTYGSPTGAPGSGTNVISITSNSIAGDATNELNGMGILAGIAGKGSANISITNNGTAALPIRHTKGSGIGIGGAGAVTVDFNVTGNFINGSDNIFGASALGMGVDTNIQADSSTLSNPAVNAIIASNTVTGSTGYGIQTLNRDSNGTTNLRMQNNSVSGPFGTGFGAIDVTSGSAGDPTFNPTVCAAIAGNTAAGGVDDGVGNTPPGIQIEKYSSSSATYKFGIVGLSPSPAPASQVETQLGSANPGSATGTGFYAGKKAGVNIGDQFTSCTLTF